MHKFKVYTSLLTVRFESKLLAYNACVRLSPQIIAHCSPYSIVTHFYMTLHIVGTVNQSKLAMVTDFRSTTNAGVFKVNTVVGSQSSAISKMGLVANAHYVVKVDWSSSLTKERKTECLWSCVSEWVGE